MNALDVVVNTLEQCAERDVDLTPLIYEDFFESCSEAFPLMGHSDQYMRGRMVAQIFEVIMDDTLHNEGGYLGWEVNAHVKDYGVKDDMYDAFFASIKKAVKVTIEEEWQDEQDFAWDARINQILAVIQRHKPAH
ncbi:MAG: hypothetical protein ACI92E_002130 [Oceanicoccus sp.]|jgi:hypothetical protein